LESGLESPPPGVLRREGACGWDHCTYLRIARLTPRSAQSISNSHRRSARSTRSRPSGPPSWLHRPVLTGQPATTDVSDPSPVSRAAGATRWRAALPAIHAGDHRAAVHAPSLKRSACQTQSGDDHNHKSSAKKVLCSAISKRCPVSSLWEHGSLHHRGRTLQQFGPCVFTRAGWVAGWWVPSSLEEQGHRRTRDRAV